MSAIVVNNPKLLDQLLNFNSYAGLFTNEIQQNDSSPVFAEPIFLGYGLFLVDKNNWGPSIKESDYAVTNYKNEIYWVNQSEVATTIRGYFLKNLNNQTLWFHVFNSPVTISKNEGIYINPKVYLNNYENLFNTIYIFNINYPNSFLLPNPSISITDEMWGDVIMNKPLLNIITGDSNYAPSSNCLVLALDSKIEITEDLPFSFKIKSTQPGFFSYTKNINTTQPGIYENTLYMIEAS